MELESEDGSKIKLEPDDPENNTVFGRRSGSNTDDRTISRRHVLFTTTANKTSGGGGVVSFEVLGKNPIWVRSNGGGKGIRVFRRFERGDVEEGDWFCVCGQDPVWFTVKRIENTELRLDDFDDINVSNIDPVKEFGFLVIGHEFDQYPKQMVRDVKHWDWFLEEPRKNSDDDEDGEVKRSSVGRKRKKTKGNEDDDWTSDDDADKEQIAKARKVPGRNYSTRSKDTRKARKDIGHDQHLAQRRSVRETEDDEEGDDDDDDDKTLGGFIVDDDNEVEPKEESDYDDDEEEEEDEDEDEEDFDNED